jgi:hypothetical protein
MGARCLLKPFFKQNIVDNQGISYTEQVQLQNISTEILIFHLRKIT